MQVTLDLEHLGLIPVGVPSHFTIKVAGGDDAELAVSVQGELNANALDKYNIFTIYYSDIGRTNYVGRPIAYLCISGVT